MQPGDVTPGWLCAGAEQLGGAGQLEAADARLWRWRCVAAWPLRLPLLVCRLLLLLLRARLTAATGMAYIGV